MSLARRSFARVLGSAARRSWRSMSSEASISNSLIPTFHFQDSLPRLPVPKLEKTLEKYLYFTQPLVSVAEHAATKEAVAVFAANEGPKLQFALEMADKSNAHTSYISEFWYDMYLKNRDPFPLNLTPQLTWKATEDPLKERQTAKAADIIHAAVRFQIALAREQLEPDVFHMKPEISQNPWFKTFLAALPRAVSYYGNYAASAYALDMSQYARLFSSTRVPKLVRDELVTAPVPSNYVVVMRGARFYKVHVMDRYGPVPVADVEAQLAAILRDSEGASPEEPAVGALTGADRDTWAQVRADMEHSPVNRATLETVDKALFVLTLEDAAPSTHEDLSRAMLHGNCRNRWFDKSFHIIVCRNGRAGIAFEHAWGDGVAVLNFFNQVHDAFVAAPSRPAPAPAAAKAVALPWDLSSRTVAAIREAGAYSDRVTKECDLDVYQTPSLTRDDVKASRLSPDGVCQMALQLAHWRAFRFTPSTYESASTAGFKHGRTETIRSATPEAAAFCALFDDPAASLDAKHAALKAAVDRHSVTTRECLTGHGVDRHLFALGKFAEKAGIPTPAIFTDKAWKVMKDIRLSTSTLASNALDGGGFGPVSRTSFGVGYGIADRGMQFHVTSYGQGNKEFLNALETGLRDMKIVMDHGATKPTTK